MECLPLEGAARMSILSAEWREYWRTIPALVFDDPRLLCRSLHSDDICNTLLQHNGPIVKFVLIIPYIHLTSAAPLILFISTNDLKEFTVIKKMGDLLELPSYIFSCANLTKLTLGRCKFNLPRSFSGFQHLVSIDFENVACLDLGSFVAKCPLLEKLSLRDIELGSNTFKLDFNMPKLKYLNMSGMLFDSINLDGCQGILSISVSLQKFLNLDENNGTKELIKFLERHSRVESLCFNKYFIKVTDDVISFADVKGYRIIFIHFLRISPTPYHLCQISY
ncbi:F-box/FBD/LRR-repeat protein At2g04230-like [Chenopodium quinoa]|uniref:F-box/FBD/LRR-repeat protein At2g04230-like n=1 Tax=Chenopodium quinoa TaxID=63459 RepID=UPI000B76F1BE|nr:F-box/FBD/LRR-repeat protein At2g04230-like [Chenopodium quinoa]